MLPPGLAASLRSGEGILRVPSALDPLQSLPGRAMDPVLRRKGNAYGGFLAEFHATFYTSNSHFKLQTLDSLLFIKCEV